MDNATAEYTFVTTFFMVEPVAPLPSSKDSGLLFSPSALLSPTKGGFDDRRSIAGSDVGRTPRARAGSIANSISNAPKQNVIMKTERTALDAIWKQIIDPILEYCQVCI